MEENSYRDSLYKTTQILGEMGEQLFTNIINLAMSGEMNDFNNEFEIGEVVHYNDADFRDLSDQNIKLIYEVLDVIARVHGSIVNINDLSDEEDDNDL